MFADRVPRIISYHDTWISIDPIQGCPYECTYCVLKHASNTGVQPKILISPDECVKLLLDYRFYVPKFTPLAIGNETDMLHPRNQDYLVDLLDTFQGAQISSPIILITKTPLRDNILERIKDVRGLRIIFFLSYSGLGRQYEPNFVDAGFRRNFQKVKEHEFSVVHYWRPLLPENTSVAQIREMLKFVSMYADASVIGGLKLHPELNSLINREGIIPIPENLLNSHGEWLESYAVKRIYSEALRICPDYPIYRHSACAIAKVLAQLNHTATIYREDICSPSHCPDSQRTICTNTKTRPEEAVIMKTLEKIGKTASFEIHSTDIFINTVVTQEEFSYLLHNLNYPLRVKAIDFENLYRGSIHDNQTAV